MIDDNKYEIGNKTFRSTIILIVIAAVVYGLIKATIYSGYINNYWQLILDQSMIITIGALGLCIIYGFAGQFSLGHAAFYGIGAYTAGVIGKVWGQGDPMWFLIAVIAGIAMAALMGFLIGVPILRLTSDYLGIATLGFGIIIKVGMDNSDKLFQPFGGATGMTGVPTLVNFDIVFWAFILTIILVRNFIDSSYGRAIVTIRDNEIAADAMGINVARYKAMAFVLGCALAGFAGSLYAYRYPYVHPDTFNFMKSWDFLIIVVLGGLGSMSGTLVIGVCWVFLLEILRMVLGDTFVEWRGVIYALILIITILVRPQGLFGGKEVRLLFPKIKIGRREEA
ncbi:MAG: branched-chain amino acid ABC transporter permease [Methylocystaceae bacterium]